MHALLCCMYRKQASRSICKTENVQLSHYMSTSKTDQMFRGNLHHGDILYQHIEDYIQSQQ